VIGSAARSDSDSPPAAYSCRNELRSSIPRI
jgi:hypothetical protein